MFTARLQSSNLFKKLIEATKELVSDANFDCTENGISLQAMDNSHVALIMLHLRTQGFDIYECDTSFSLGISLLSLSKVLKCSENDDTLSLQFSEGEDTLQMVFENTRSDRISEYDLKLMDIYSDTLAVPEVAYEAVVTMSSNEFQRICKDMLVLGENVVLDVEKDRIAFTSNGEIGKANVIVKSGSGTSIELLESVSASFSLRYLFHFTKATPLSDTVVISLSANIPILVAYPISDVGYIRYYLAPKIAD